MGQGTVSRGREAYFPAGWNSPLMLGELGTPGAAE